jgi:hypothetical protein
MDSSMKTRVSHLKCEIHKYFEGQLTNELTKLVNMVINYMYASKYMKTCMIYFYLANIPLDINL